MNCGGMFDRAARLLAFAFRFFLDGSLGTSILSAMYLTMAGA